MMNKKNTSRPADQRHLRRVERKALEQAADPSATSPLMRKAPTKDKPEVPENPSMEVLRRRV